MATSLFEIGASCGASFISVLQYPAEKYNKHSQNADFFQKTFQVTLAALELCSCNSFGPLKKVFKVVSWHDPLRIIKRPNDYFNPINLGAVNQGYVFQSVKDYVLTKLRDRDSLVTEQTKNYANVAIKKSLNSIFDSMNSKNDAFEDYEKFNEFLKRSLTADSKKRTVLKDIDFSDLTLTKKCESKFSIVDYLKDGNWLAVVDYLIDWNWFVVEIECWGLFLPEINLVDLAKCAGRIGQIPGLGKVKDYALENVVQGAVVAGFGVTFFKAACDFNLKGLLDLFVNWELTKSQKRTLHDLVTSAAELVFQGIQFGNCMKYTTYSKNTLDWCQLVAKGIGWISFLCKPSPVDVVDPVENV